MKNLPFKFVVNAIISFKEPTAFDLYVKYHTTSETTLLAKRRTSDSMRIAPLGQDRILCAANENAVISFARDYVLEFEKQVQYIEEQLKRAKDIENFINQL